MDRSSIMHTLTYKYDSKLDYNISLYDKLPYERDCDYCGASNLGLESGHIVKYYRCLNKEQARLVNNQDEKIEQFLAREKKRYAELASNLSTEPDSQDSNVGITEEQIQTLLDDSKETPEFDSTENSEDTSAPEGAIDAFTDVEDW